MTIEHAPHRPPHIDALIATGLLDSPQERRFDRLTRLAAAALRVPVSLISLVDVERQFFKSQTGLPDTLGRTPGDATDTFLLQARRGIKGTSGCA